MQDAILDIQGTRVLVLATEGAKLADGASAQDFLGEAWSQDADLLAVPVSRLGEGFLDLSTRMAGEVVQKFVNYRLRLAIVGDISARCAQSQSLRDFVYESNGGRALWFVSDLDTLRQRLSGVAIA